MDFITGPGSANKEQAEKSCISLITILFSPQVYIILQTAPVFNAYAQINLLSGKGKTDRKSRTATAQRESHQSYCHHVLPEKHTTIFSMRSLKRAQSSDFVIDLTSQFKIRMMLYRSSIMVLCFGRDL